MLLIMETKKTPLSWRSRFVLLAGALISVIWAITLYWSLVANRYLETPWTL